MASKKEIKEWLNKSGYTFDDMDNFWNELKETNSKVRMLSSQGIKWSDMNMTVIQGLPFQKEKDEKSRLEKEALEKKKQEELQKKIDDEIYYSEHFEDIMLDKIEKGISLTESELSDIVSEYLVESEYGSSGRWQRSVTSIVKIKGRYFSIMWQKGLTEYQEDSFPEQPREVFPVKITKVIEKVEFHYEKQEEYSEEVCKSEDVLSILNMSYINSDSSYSIIKDGNNIILKEL